MRKTTAKTTWCLNRPPLLKSIAVTLTMFAAITPASATDRDFANHINSANTAVRNKDFDAAIAKYESAAEIVHNREELPYNKAVALYRKGDITAAQVLFDDVATSLNSNLAARARFNAGNCRYHHALSVVEQDRDAAVEQLHQAISCYRSALKLDHTDADARTNIELAAKLLKQLQQQEDEQQQQNKDEQLKEQQQSDQSQSSDDQNESEQQKNQDQPQNQDQQQQDSEESKDGAQQQNTDQQQTSDNESQSDESQSEQKQGEQSMDQQQQSSSPNSPSQNHSQTEPDNSTPGDENKNEAAEQDQDDKQTPQGELATANESDERQTDETTAAISVEQGEITDEEARKMLQAIRDRDMLRRLRRQAAERSRYIPVERDW